MKELYEQLGISSKVYDFGAEIEASLKERFEQFDKTAEYNQLKVLMAMQKNKVSAESVSYTHLKVNVNAAKFMEYVTVV